VTDIAAPSLPAFASKDEIAKRLRQRHAAERRFRA
jgi:hypothetical protein